MDFAFTWLVAAVALSAAEQAPAGLAEADAQKIQAVIDQVERSCMDRRVPMIGPKRAIRLAELVRQAKPKLVVECGTAIGYSALWIARELKAAGGGRLVTIEIREENAKEAETHLRKAGLQDYVTVRLGDARKVCAEIEGPIDFAFIDCGSSNYFPCFMGLEKKLIPGATVVADNASLLAEGMQDYLEHVRSKYQSRMEWFDMDLPWVKAKRDAMEITIIRPRQ